MNFLIWASIEMVISNNPWFVYDEGIFTPKELDNFKKSYAKTKYGDRLLVNLSKDLTRLKGHGFSRSVLTYMRKFYLAFPKCATVSHKLSWSHYIELLYTDGMDPSFSTPWDSFVLTLPKFNVDGVEDVYISSDDATNQGGQKDILYS